MYLLPSIPFIKSQAKSKVFISHDLKSYRECVLSSVTCGTFQKLVFVAVRGPRCTLVRRRGCKRARAVDFLQSTNVRRQATIQNNIYYNIILYYHCKIQFVIFHGSFLRRQLVSYFRRYNIIIVLLNGNPMIYSCGNSHINIIISMRRLAIGSR